MFAKVLQCTGEHMSLREAGHEKKSFNLIIVSLHRHSVQLVETSVILTCSS